MKIIIQRIKAKAYAFCFWQTRFGEIFNKIYDLYNFYKYAFRCVSKQDQDNDKLRASLIKEYHIVEKGLALPIPRLGFGKEKIPILITNASNYEKNYGSNNCLIQCIKDSLAEYIVFNESNGINVETPYYQSIRNFIDGNEKKNIGGTKIMIREDINKSIQFDYKQFVEQRVSVRDFSSEEISKDEIINAVNIAKIAPSVCNRQNWKAHVYTNKGDIAEILKYQHGNEGFGHKIKVLILITTNVKGFTKLESNQVFIDGGIFSMSMILALHAEGLGSCALNTCIPCVDEKKIKLLGDIPPNERVIMMIGVGKLKDKFIVPVSLKKKSDEIVKFH